MSIAAFIADQCLAYLLKHPRQKRSGQTISVRPPWSAAPDIFQSRCTGCGDCAPVCPNQLISLDSNGLPVVDFSTNFCTFCGECARSCPTQALVFNPATPPWDVRAAISDACLLAHRVLCRSCADHCPQGAIIFSLQEARLPEISIDKCTGCGACGNGCPTNAISFTYEEAQ